MRSPLSAVLLIISRVMYHKHVDLQGLTTNDSSQFVIILPEYCVFWGRCTLCRARASVLHYNVAITGVRRILAKVFVKFKHKSCTKKSRSDDLIFTNLCNSSKKMINISLKQSGSERFDVIQNWTRRNDNRAEETQWNRRESGTGVFRELLVLHPCRKNAQKH